jgi:hypothetical protein
MGAPGAWISVENISAPAIGIARSRAFGVLTHPVGPSLLRLAPHAASLPKRQNGPALANAPVGTTTPPGAPTRSLA